VEPNATALFVFDGIRLLDRALTACGSIDVKCVHEQMVGGRPLAGLLGEWKPDQNGKSKRIFGIKQIVAGQAVWLK
jgi:hypothetical protein